MSAVTDPPTKGFRPSMLINDTRYRGLTFQFIALVLLIFGIGYLISNLLSNLAAAGLDISYGFLTETSGYDISQKLIPYTSQSTHLRAAVVGLLNTLLVSALACVTATIFGVIAGILRLSKNWLVSRLMAAYVEAFRNVPVLIWILIIGTIMTVVFPSPSAFRGDEPEASMLLSAFAFTNRGVYVPAPVAGQGSLILLAVVIASIVGMFAYRRYVKKLLYDTGRLLPSGWPSLAILVLPGLLTYLALAATVGSQPQRVVVPAGYDGATLESFAADIGGVNFCDVNGKTGSITAKSTLRELGGGFNRVEVSGYQGAFTAFANEECNMMVLPATMSDALPSDMEGGVSTLETTLATGGPLELEVPYLAGFNFDDGIQVLGAFIALWFALSIYTGAFIAENVRAGITSVDKGQTEAAGSLGLRPRRVMNLVVLPQALRVIVPPLISHYLNITKNSSLAIAVGYADITATLGGITLNQTGRAIETILLLMLFYLTISLCISGVMNVYNASVSLKER